MLLTIVKSFVIVWLCIAVLFVVIFGFALFSPYINSAIESCVNAYGSAMQIVVKIREVF